MLIICYFVVLEPTLRREYAMVRSEHGPVSSLAAAAAHTHLQIDFRNGPLNVTKENT